VVSATFGLSAPLPAQHMRFAIRHIQTAIAAMATVLTGTAMAPAHAQSITNVATIEWDAGAARVSRQSNRVDLTVERPQPQQAALVTYQLADGPDAIRVNVPSTVCTGSNGPQTVGLTGVFAGTAMAPATISPTTKIHAGEPLVIGVTSASNNQNANEIETFSVRLTTPSGDSEVITLTESGADTGIFFGMITTAAIPPAPVPSDCRLSVYPGETLRLTGLDANTGTLIATSPVEVLIDPYGVVFDSADGTPVAGVRVTLIDVATGQPTQVFGDDGVSTFPNSIVTGSTVTDSSGAVYRFPAGDYRFPFARAGQYRLLVEPIAPYSAPSAASPAELAGFRRPDGPPFTITTASYGSVFTLSGPSPVRIDIPIDKPGAPLVIRKTASQPVAVAGDAVQYRITLQNGDANRPTGAVTVTDQLPSAMRLRADTVRYNGSLTSYSVTSDGRILTIPLPSLAAKTQGVVTYLLEVRPDAQPGYAMNRAQARDSRGSQSAVADAMVRIARDGIGDRVTIIGRITDGGCTVDPEAANGIGGVRVMLEDGTYTVTDVEGRYHFAGVLPGLHVVQMDPSTLPSGQVAADCTRNARGGGSAISRFVEGRGGSLLRVDFRSVAGDNKDRLVGERASREAPMSDKEAAGAERDWFAGQQPGTGWVFPESDHNPRSRAIRIAIKHGNGQSIRLFRDGKAVDPLSFDGTRRSGDGQIAISLWRGVELDRRDTLFTAEVVAADGSVLETLTRKVHFSASPMRAEFVREKSVLVADGVTRPVIALRMTDRDGFPVHHGLVGDFEVPAPYAAAVEADAQAARQLSGLERARPVWHVQGDDGIAYIELEPTTASGSLTINLPLRDEQVSRRQRIDLWLDPGKRPWTIVGFAAGTAGFNTLDARSESIGADQQNWFTDARLALYAKGRVHGKWLMTLAYDSDKDKDDARFAGTIDPNAYYTIYADRSEQRHDAASVRRLYLKLERPQFYALFGDYETAINEPQLSRYSRAFNGAKAEYKSEQVGVTAFVADTPFRHRREEIQGNGLSGPYALGARDILPNSERVIIEIRDRLRSARIVETRTLVRHIDYDIDYIAGTLRFREPVLSRASGLDPQFIVVDYEVDGVAQRVTNAGGRATWANEKKTLIIGATAIHDEDEDLKTNQGGVDIRYTPTANTEIRAEFAVSDGSVKTGSTLVNPGTNQAWLVEAEHHSAKVDVLAYAREQQRGFGVGQTNQGENGTRKFGLDARTRISQDFSVTASAWQEDYLNSVARRQAGRILSEYRTKGMDLRAGVTLANDRLDDGRTASSTIGQIGATKRFFNNTLELDAQTEIPLADRNDSIDFPARHKLGARYAVTNDIALVGAYEIAKGDVIDARTARIGFDLKPWAGARFTSSVNSQSTNEYGPRTFAAYGLAQSLPLGKKWTIDFSLDGNKALGGFDPARVLNENQPIASGGFVGTTGVIAEDFTALTAGATYRSDKWSVTGRAEVRASALGDRYGITTGALRQIGEGRAFGGGFSWFRANQKGGAQTEAASLQLSWAHRPDDSRFAFLNKLELRSDKVSGAVAGLPGPIGGAALNIQGDASSKRIINSFSLNWSPTEKNGDEYLNRSEVGFFWGSRYVADKFGADDLKGWSNIFGADLRFDLKQSIDIGVSGTLRQNPSGNALSYSGGPAIGLSPMKNSYISVGYNVVGYSDRDFEDSRYTRSGPYVTLRLKFDQNTLAGLGLGR
jgi:uncharacterized repeat protein (TIGR01451 family)